ncbi:uracil-DNA glycosylase [Lingula anatina]|uniref:Uracil-DNA glycosylase n=1 Tax=Lingula anatina TaxID=7574 RepID=A0A1S3GY69_LINAN|nr:uracil-DNA glycosylase [Lingula anatina]|eukprot:XP_013378607.1 uracil-DNA glycosylase [Lingula anatina]
MIGQQKISSFFSPVQQKRPLCSKEDTNVPVKKAKNDPADSKENVHEALTSPSLSPEQKQRIDRNQAAAKAKRIAAQTKGLVVNMGASWMKALEPEFSKPYFTKLSEFIHSERQKSLAIFPPADQVFTWTQMEDIKNVKVVILGQDPYHGDGQAHGLCFSVPEKIRPPPSLENMFKELESDIEGFKPPGHGNLTGWAQQDVLLLNAVLTVQAHRANSHKDMGWEKFTDAVVSWINKNLHGVVFMLWGSYAQKKGACVDKKRHHVLSTVHPSPLSAYRGFLGCKHFSKANELLKKQGKKPIDWTYLPKPCNGTFSPK